MTREIHHHCVQSSPIGSRRVSIFFFLALLSPSRKAKGGVHSEIDDVIGVRQLLPLYGVHIYGPKLTPLPKGLMPYYASGHGRKRNNVLHAYTYTSSVVVLAPFFKKYVRCMLYHARVALVDGRFDFRAFFYYFSAFRIVPRE